MILDLFAGPGGWSEGVRALGLSEVGLEWDAAACETRAAAGHPTIRCDVARYPVEPFVGRVRGLIASPPCQAWSMAGKGAGRAEVDRVHAAVELCRGGWTDAAREGPWLDERTPLILEVLRWAWTLRDSLEWIACEQVPPALGVWEHMADVLRGWGFRADARVLCAADYGVPQTRNRAFLLAHRTRLAWPEPTHAQAPEPSLFGASRTPWVSMAAALGWDGIVTGNNTGAGTNLPRASSDPAMTLGSRADLWRLRGNQKPPDMGGEYHSVPVDQPAQTITANAKSYQWVHDRPAPTVTGGGTASGGGAEPFAHGVRRWGDAARIEVWEAGVLQGFRPDYPWRGSRSKQYEQVGNAVTPPLAAAIIGSLEGAARARRAA